MSLVARALPGAFLRLADPGPAELGLAAERWVARRLARRGWRILGRRLVTRAHEVDLVALDAGELVLVEVKAGRRFGRFRPGDRLDARRLRALHAAGRELAAHGGARGYRIDLVEVHVRRSGLELHHRRRVGAGPPPGSCPGDEP